ncbi:hypothetical protein [Tenacibaculum soleae]|uniref:Uncharacterized protein n=1 Tax=Tenacibaculum soleae TaxID=447689 RepID=A0A1B9XWX9_9FLAO|nr:hypothetical protein [Tenacibaculum soleae]MDO6813464.1 hypothetical protein [Tenacibaculum soleae]OCK42067.1 hypothetical protein BA195_12720 [Tenacibaculum soleae]
MKIEEKSNYVLISSEANNFSDFFLNFEKEHVNYNKKHLVVKISENFNYSKQNILLFLDYAHEHQKNGTSFVIVLKDVNIDDFPENLNIVPTLVEAQDVIEMENIQRDLGF